MDVCITILAGRYAAMMEVSITNLAGRYAAIMVSLRLVYHTNLRTLAGICCLPTSHHFGPISTILSFSSRLFSSEMMGHNGDFELISQNIRGLTSCYHIFARPPSPLSPQMLMPI